MGTAASRFSLENVSQITGVQIAKHAHAKTGFAVTQVLVMVNVEYVRSMKIFSLVTECGMVKIAMCVLLGRNSWGVVTLVILNQSSW
jgi:hypothetical protein